MQLVSKKLIKQRFIKMKKGSAMTYLKKPVVIQKNFQEEEEDLDLNIFVVTFKGMKDSEANISEGDPYSCKKCKAILNRYSTIVSAQQLENSENRAKIELSNNESLWECEFCAHPNVIKIDKEEIPKKDEVYYLVESELEHIGSENDSTMIFCIDISGSMNTTSEVEGKIDLKFGLSQEEIEMLKQFMEPGDEAQFNFLPGNHNKNKTFISRKQCILSAIQSQLKEIKKTDPHKRVGFVTFNSEITVIGDSTTPPVTIVGDKLKDKQAIIDSLNGFKITEPLLTSYDHLSVELNKQEAKGQTALGPAFVSALEVASKGSLGSTVFLCTDGLANIGIGLLDPLSEEGVKFYEELAESAKAKNITVNIMTIKGESSKMEVIGKLAEYTNGNMKVVNPEKLAEDFANVLKDEVVGLNVETTILLHKAMHFRNEPKDNLFENETVLKKKLANATANTKISFEYEIRSEEDLKFMEINVEELKKVPFQTQVLYTSPKGGKYLRVISSESKTTTDKKQIYKEVNIGVAHQRATTVTANMYSYGDYEGSKAASGKWKNYISKNLPVEKCVQKQQYFQKKMEKLTEAIEYKAVYAPKIPGSTEMKIIEEQPQSEIKIRKAKEDEYQMEYMEDCMEKQNFDLD